MRFFMTSLGVALLHTPCVAAEIPAAIASDQPVILQVHATGAQIYECKAEAGGALKWVFREPIATLLEGNKTVGHHFAGPSWEAADGSTVTGKLAGKAPGASEKDIPWLKLDVAEHRHEGIFGKVTTVQRIDTEGGTFDGACATAGVLHAEPYTAEYIFRGK